MNRARKLIYILAMAFVVFMSVPQVAHANDDSCLSVRDYGEHRYDHRIYQKHTVTFVPLYTYPDGSILFGFGYFIDRGECVCGKEGQMLVIEYVQVGNPAIA